MGLMDRIRELFGGGSKEPEVEVDPEAVAEEEAIDRVRFDDDAKRLEAATRGLPGSADRNITDY